MQVRIATWNLATNGPPTDLSNILDWEKALGYSQINGTEDLVVFGLQETIPQTTAVWDVFSGPQDASFAEGWSQNSDGLAPWARFMKSRLEDVGLGLVLARRFFGISLLIFASTALRMGRISWSFTGLGLFGIYGNKGALIGSMEVDWKGHGPVSLCFGSLHLSPHRGLVNMKNRIEDLEFLFDYARVDNRTLSQFDHVFLFGDFNFRMAPSELLSGDAKNNPWLFAVDMIQRRQYSEIIQLDELILAKGRPEHPLRVFQEAPIYFSPSYKLEMDRERASESIYARNRVPSYCDRILFAGSIITPVFYDKIESNFSDHHCVVGSFTINPIRNRSRSIEDPQRSRTWALALRIWKKNSWIAYLGFSLWVLSRLVLYL